jgi:tRNA A-37 threonylcarbamoyl transferase component Bud32
MAIEPPQNPLTQADPLSKKTEAENPVAVTATAAGSAASSTGAYLGTVLKDRYLIESVIGRGGIGVVYLARDQKLVERRVVIKVLHQTVADSAIGDWTRKKFQHEIEALSRIDHPGVVGVLDTGEMPDGRAYFVMQYVEGETLRSAMDSSGDAGVPQGMEFRRAGHLIRQMAQAMGAAHDKGVLHRDLKPENIMLQRLGEGDELVKLIDFGIAHVADPKIAPETHATMVAGTPPYMAPEQIRGRPSAASDIFSLGAIAYEMLAASLPFQADTTVGLYEAQREGVRIKPREARPSLPAAAETAILRALSFDESARQPRVRDFGEELARALLDAPAATNAGRATEAIRAQATGASVARTGVQGNRRKLAIGAVSLVALAALIVLALRNRPAPQIQPVPPAPTRIERALDYWIVVQKYRNQQPYGDSFTLPGSILFEAGDRFFLHLSAPQPGHFYLLNEGPQPVGGLPAYILLFPAPNRNNGSAQIAADQALRFPEQGNGFKLDSERGTEKLWLIWSEAAVPELEAVKSVVNPTQQGAISDPAAIRSVRDYLAKAQTESPAAAREDKEKNRTRVTSSAAALVHRIELLHY